MYNQTQLNDENGGFSVINMPPVPAHQVVTLAKATRATTDEQLLVSWLSSLTSGHTQRNFEMTARRFLVELRMGLRQATVEDVRDALAKISAGKSEASARQYVLRVKSLLGYAQKLGYTPFNAGATIKVRSDAANRGANLAKRIMSEVEVSLLIRAAPSKRDRVMLEVIYAGGLRVSEIVALTWSDVLTRDQRVQLSIAGKGGKVRQVLLPEVVSRSLLSLRGDAGANDPVFISRKGAGRLLERTVNRMVKRAAAEAGVNEAVSPHWLRHAHGSHAIDRGASLPEVQTTLGHGNIATTSGYLHARPDTSSGLHLDPGVFLR
ncbi:MAG TPA: tyrosine-type recombinase/integrase [Hyphomicrobiaceae bacterium]|nr:tyrosine-type recombinase/integrase [Hyphomicrobiaceae bacterium]